ncbi:MAG: glycosyltransferase family 4 protein [bacterium]|nr:glycosyltransferase family 4 protein [bacterium]
MRILVVGDYRTGTGPANVTRSYLARLPEDTLRLRCTGKCSRVFEILYQVMRADIVLCSGYSGQNILAIKWAHMLHKPAAYLMHGCVEHENTINGVPDTRMNEIERQTLKLSDAIIAVSAQFAGWLWEHYPEYMDKIEYITNGVDWDGLKALKAEGIREPGRIMSIGGGMPRKMIRYICEAIHRLNQTEKMNLKLTVIGDTGYDSQEINAYPFVENKGLVSFDETVRLLYQSKLYIQNSCFETFGLAPLEAFACGCDLLLSSQIGARFIFKNLSDDDIIFDYSDPEEIAEKIKSVLQQGNNERLQTGIDKESTSWEARTKQLLELLQRVKEKSI